MPGEAPFSAIVEAGQPWGDTRINRKLDARWRGMARGLLDGVTHTTVTRVFQAGNGADGETVTTTGADGTVRVYEFDTAAAPGAITAGNVRVGLSGPEGGVGQANVATNLAAAINGDANRVVDAVVESFNTGTVVYLTSTDARNYGDLGGIGYRVTETGGNTTARNFPNAAGAGSGVTPLSYQVCHGSYNVGVGDAAIIAAGDEVAITCVRFQPTFGQYQVLVAATGAIVPLAATMTFNWTQIGTSGKFALMVTDSVPAIVAGTMIHWSASIY